MEQELQVNSMMHNENLHFVSWRKNLFRLQTRNGGKQYIKKVARLLNTRTQNPPLKSFSLKARLVRYFKSFSPQV